MSKRKEEMSESDSPLEWRLRAIVGEDNLLVDEPMSEHTTFEIGGPADFYVIPEDFDEVRDVITACKDAGADYFVLGCGSDLLVSDEGYRGVIVAVADGLMGVSVEGDQMCCQAGVGLREASEMACELGLSGLEFACGIPGSVGGACFMNAGAYGGCMADGLKEVRVLLPDGSLDDVAVEDLALGYRQSRIADEGWVVLSATFDLDRGDPEKIRATMDDLTHQREEKQPLELPSAGSTFKRRQAHHRRGPQGLPVRRRRGQQEARRLRRQRRRRHRGRRPRRDRARPGRGRAHLRRSPRARGPLPGLGGAQPRQAGDGPCLPPPSPGATHHWVTVIACSFLGHPWQSRVCCPPTCRSFRVGRFFNRDLRVLLREYPISLNIGF